MTPERLAEIDYMLFEYEQDGEYFDHKIALELRNALKERDAEIKRLKLSYEERKKQGLLTGDYLKDTY